MAFVSKALTIVDDDDIVELSDEMKLAWVGGGMAKGPPPPVLRGPPPP